MSAGGAPDDAGSIDAASVDAARVEFTEAEISEAARESQAGDIDANPPTAAGSSSSVQSHWLRLTSTARTSTPCSRASRTNCAGA